MREDRGRGDISLRRGRNDRKRKRESAIDKVIERE